MMRIAKVGSGIVAVVAHRNYNAFWLSRLFAVHRNGSACNLRTCAGSKVNQKRGHLRRLNPLRSVHVGIAAAIRGSVHGGRQDSICRDAAILVFESDSTDERD